MEPERETTMSHAAHERITALQEYRKRTGGVPRCVDDPTSHPILLQRQTLVANDHVDTSIVVPCKRWH
jgi:hypothetical protein